MKDRLYIILYSIDVIPPSWPPLTTAPSSDDEPHKTEKCFRAFIFLFQFRLHPLFGLQFNGGITTMSFTTSKKKKKAGRVQTTLQEEEESQEGEKKSWGSQSFEGYRASTSLLLHEKILLSTCIQTHTQLYVVVFFLFFSFVCCSLSTSLSSCLVVFVGLRVLKNKTKILLMKRYGENNQSKLVSVCVCAFVKK